MKTLADFEKFTSAKLLGKAQHDTPEWHRLRSEDAAIGGSDIGVILGLSPFTSPYALWAKRMGLIADTVKSDAMEWGNRLESAIAQKFADGLTDGNLLTDFGTYSHPERTWQRANPDGIYWTGKTWALLEVKTARDETYWKNADGVMEVPATYRAQVNWYLDVMGLHEATVAVLFGGSRYYEFQLTRDQFEIDLAVAKAQEFRSYLLNGTVPELTAPFTATLEAVRAQHPDIDADDAVELGDLGVNCANAIAELDAAKEKADEFKAHVLKAMGNARRGLIYDVWQFTRQSRAGGVPYLVNRK